MPTSRQVRLSGSPAITKSFNYRIESKLGFLVPRPLLLLFPWAYYFDSLKKKATWVSYNSLLSNKNSKKERKKEVGVVILKYAHNFFDNSPFKR